MIRKLLSDEQRTPAPAGATLRYVVQRNEYRLALPNGRQAVLHRGDALGREHLAALTTAQVECHVRNRLLRLEYEPVPRDTV